MTDAERISSHATGVIMAAKISRRTKIAYILGEYSTYGYNKPMLWAQLARLYHMPDDLIDEEFTRLGNTKVAYLWSAVFGIQQRVAI